VVPSFLAVPSLLVQSDLIALIPQTLARLARGIICRPPPLPVPGFDVALAWHTRRDTDPAVAFVRDEIARIGGTLQSKATGRRPGTSGPRTSGRPPRPSRG
jgi:DNA-binding transcriptional LysR family regulator